MTKRTFYNLARAAFFLTLPVFFYTRPLMPRPLQIQFLAFGLAVLAAEVLRRIVPAGWTGTLNWLPFLAAALAIMPYWTFLAYFDPSHQVLIGFFLLLGIVYRYGDRIIQTSRYD